MIQKKAAFTTEESVGNVPAVVTDATLQGLPGMDPEWTRNGPGMDPVPTANNFNLLAGEDIDTLPVIAGKKTVSLVKNSPIGKSIDGDTQTTIGRVTFHWEVKFRDRNLLMDESRLYSVLLPVVHNGITLQVHNPARRGEKSAISSRAV